MTAGDRGAHPLACAEAVAEEAAHRRQARAACAPASAGAGPTGAGAEESASVDAAFSDTRFSSATTDECRPRPRIRMTSGTLPPSTDAGARASSRRASPPRRAPRWPCCRDCRPAPSVVHTPDGATHQASGAHHGPTLHATLARARLGRVRRDDARRRHRFRRGLPGRPLDDAAPGRPAAPAAGQPRRHREGDLRLVVGPAAAPRPARAQPQHAAAAAAATSARTTTWATRSTRLWLDETMNYSSAWFDGDLAKPLPQAQSGQAASRHCRHGCPVPANGCWKSAAAGARWPKAPPATASKWWD